MNALGKRFETEVCLHQPNLIKDIVRRTRREQEIGAGGTLVIPTLKVAVGQFGEHGVVHCARLHQRRQHINGVIGAVNTLEVPGLGEHGVSMSDLRSQRDANHHP